MSALSVAMAQDTFSDIAKEMDLIDRGINELSNFLDSVHISHESKNEDAKEPPEM